MYVQITNVENGPRTLTSGGVKVNRFLRRAEGSALPNVTQSARMPMAVRAAIPGRSKARGSYLSNPVSPELTKSRNNNAKETAIAARL
jgi:hypothetical protein